MGKKTSGLSKNHYKYDQLVALREQTGKSLRELASDFNITKSVLHRAETGVGVTYPVLCALANAYKVPVVSLLIPAPEAVAK